MYNNDLVRFVRDGWDRSTMDIFSKMMTSSDPFTFGRIGGVDFTIAAMYYNNPNCFDDIKVYTKEVHRARNFPGYFDFENKKENFILYAQKMITFLKDFDSATDAGVALCQIEVPEWECPAEIKKILDYILLDKILITGIFIGCVTPFLNSFKTWGEGKTILVISPFSKSVQFQYQRKDQLIKDYTFPNFKLITYNTKMTWQSPTDTKETLGLITNNWHEECDRISDDISKIDFDIAFLSCGAYAMHLGYFIKNTMHKKSIYIGGCMNMMFGIYGKRFVTQIYEWAHCNPEYIIDPFENEDIKNITAGRENDGESIQAYFGHQKG